MSVINPDDFVFVPEDKCIVVIKDGKPDFMVSAKVAVQQMREYEDVSRMLAMEQEYLPLPESVF